MQKPSNTAGIDWKERLLTRRYHFPPAGDTDKDWAVRIDHDGSGYWFPLRTTDRELAATKANRIYEAVQEQGWETVCGRYSRELILSFEWCSSPILWTYTTIHTLVKAVAAEKQPVGSTLELARVIILETDAGIRRALQWCVGRNQGFQAFSCDSPERFLQMQATRRPSLILLNRSLADRVGVDLSGGITALKPGVLALGYSVSVDGDQMFVSTPGGVDGYMLKRVKPAGVFDPVVTVVGRTNAGREDYLGAVKNYFKELLRARLNADTQALARLTPRENDVLALLSKGCVDKEIAQALGISVWTVHGHIKKIFERLRVRTRTEAVVRYLEK